VRDKKWIKKALLFEPKASFKAFPFFVLHNWEPEGQWQRGRLSLLPFFGEAKKVSGCRAIPDLLNDKAARVAPALRTLFLFFVFCFLFFVFDLHPLLTLPIVQDRKWIKKALLSERSEFQGFPIFCLAQLGSRRPVAAWAPFFAYLLWRSKESKWLSGHTRPANDEQQSNAGCTRPTN
jgi:hypothetical protein